MIQDLKALFFMGCLLAAGFIVGIERGDCEPVYEFVADMKPCPDEFFDPWSGVTNCE